MSPPRTTQATRERLAVLETQMGEVRGSVSNIERKLDAVLSKQDKQKGFFGGVVLLSSALWSAFTWWKHGG